MKTILASLVVIFGIVSAACQKEFAPSDGVWYENKSYDLTGSAPWESYLEILKVKGDTTINGELYKQIGSELFIQRGESVYYHRSGTDYLLYKYDVNVGDTLEFHYPSNWYPGELEPYKGVVADVENEELSGVQLKRIDLDWIDLPEFEPPFSYYEVFGSVAGLIPNGWNPIPETQQKFLRCYLDGKIEFKSEYFRRRGGERCDIVSKSKDVNEEGMWIEQDGSDIILRDPNDEVGNLNICDLYGRRIFVVGSNQVFNLQSGVWILAVELKSGEQRSLKICVN